MLWISHRGESCDAPENTMSAFNLAWSRNTDGVECDIQLTQDNEIICIHDYDTARISDRKLIIAESTLAELRGLDCGAWKSRNFIGEKIPLLSELLAGVPEDKLVLIEIKVGTEIVGPMRDVIKKSGVSSEQIVIICYEDEVIAECKKQMPELKACLLAGFEEDKETGELHPSAEELIARVKAINADGVDIHCNEKLEKDFFQHLHEAGMMVFTWTIDDISCGIRFKNFGVDGITSNCAKALMAGL